MLKYINYIQNDTSEGSVKPLKMQTEKSQAVHREVKHQESELGRHSEHKLLVLSADTRVPWVIFFFFTSKTTANPLNFLANFPVSMEEGEWKEGDMEGWNEERKEDKWNDG